MNAAGDFGPQPTLRIGSREIGGNNGLFVVAEIGTSHDGDPEKARRLIEAAAEAGADCAKFQIVFAEEIVHPNTGLVPLPGGDLPLFERFRAVQREPEFYHRLKEVTETTDMIFLCSVFGIRSARLLREMHPEALKIASPELNHQPLLREVGSYGLPIILSTGVSNLGDIDRALETVGRENRALLHCVTAYPAPPADYNLRVMSGLESLFGVPVGVSDHSLDPFIVPALASAMGAAILEKHLTLSREGGGLDDPVALVPEDFGRMVNAVRRARTDGLEETIRRLGVPRDDLLAVLGTGVKHLAPSEAESYLRTNRSLHAAVDIPAGTPLTPDNTVVLRTEKKLRPGLSPYHWNTVIGALTSRAIPAGEGIRWQDLLRR